MKATSTVMTSVVLLGDDDIRFQSRHALASLPGVSIVGELAAFAPRHLRFIEALHPEAVVVDCGAAKIDVLRALTEIRDLEWRPRVIAVDSTGSGKGNELRGLGATSLVRTHDELRAAVLPAIRPLTPVASYERAA